VNETDLALFPSPSPVKGYDPTGTDPPPEIDGYISYGLKADNRRWYNKMRDQWKALPEDQRNTIYDLYKSYSFPFAANDKFN
jgi:hypothetical protein